MTTKFQHVGYHLDVYCVHTKKYLGSVDVPDHLHKNCIDRKKGYYGRKQEKIVATGRRGTKDIKFSGEYITELIPLCGRIVGDRFATIAQARMKNIQIYGR